MKDRDPDHKFLNQLIFDSKTVTDALWDDILWYNYFK